MNYFNFVVSQSLFAPECTTLLTTNFFIYLESADTNEKLAVIEILSIIG